MCAEGWSRTCRSADSRTKERDGESTIAVDLTAKLITALGKVGRQYVCT